MHRDQEKPADTRTEVARIIRMADLEDLEAAQSATWLFDLERHGMVWGNSRALAFWGSADRADLLARDFSDDSPSVRERLRHLYETHSHGRPVIDTWTLYPLGRPVTVALRYTAVRLECGQRAFLIEVVVELDLARDPTALRMLETARISALMVSSFDMDGRLIIQNPAASECHGTGASRAPEGVSALQQRVPDTALLDRILAVASTGERLDTEAAVITALGPRWHRLIAERGRDPLSGRPVIILIEDDITERRRADEAQERSQLEARRRSDAAAELSRSRLLTAIEAIPDGFCLYDREDRLVLFNRAYREAYPGHADVLQIGRTFEDMLRIGVERGDFSSAEGRETEWTSERLRTHRHPHGPVEQRLSDGRWLRVVERRTDDGELVGLRTDITPLKTLEEKLRRSEERLRDFATAAADWFWETDAEHRFTYMSSNITRIVGVPPDWHYGRTRIELRSEDDDPADWEAHLAALARREPFRNFEYRRVATGIEPRWLRISGVPIFDAGGAFQGYRGSGTDVTAQREMQSELIQQKEALFHAQKLEAIGKLTGGIAHDFNNLLAIVQGNLELVREISDPADIEACIRDALTASQRGAHLIQQLLAFGRRARLNPQPTTLNAELAEIEPMLRRTLPVTIELVVTPGPEPKPVKIDRAGLTNAIVNIALNAQDAMPQGGRLLLSTASRLVAEGDPPAGKDRLAPGHYAQITIADSGTGMAPDVLEQAFEPFFTTKAVGRGSGLGLSMVHGFAKQSGGGVCLRSHPGEGTAVTLIFPVVDAQTAGRKDHTAQPVNRTQRARVLLVEDEALVRATIARQLAHIGYEVVEAVDGISARDLLETEDAFALVLADVVVPGPIQGTDLADHVHRAHPGLPVILMSGYGDLEPDHPFAGRHLSKPITTSDLAQAIRETLYVDRSET
ncbi:MAG: PAS-domain containing protein [Pseudomonadota bacterium]